MATGNMIGATMAAGDGFTGGGRGRSCWMGWLACLLGGVVAGCAPSHYLARKMVEAPNRVPEFVKPEGRVILRWPKGMEERFPTGTNQVGDPAVGLRWIRVEPGDFRMETKLEPRFAGGHAGADIRFSFRLPQDGLPPAPPAKGTVFVLHGYGMDLESMFPWAMYLADAGWRAILVDLRGHGRSGGKRVGFGTWETNDLRELRLALEREGTITGPCAVLGHSLGAAVALRWASLDPAIQGAVALAPFADFGRAAERLRREYASWLPSGWVRRAASRVPGLIGATPASLNPLEALRNREVRGFVVMADGDRVAPPEDGAMLREVLGPGSGWMIVGPATHETMPFLFVQHGERIREWLSGLGGR